MDIEKGSDPYEGPTAVDPGVYSGDHDEAKPTDGMWAKFDHYNRKLERKIGIETVRVLLGETPEDVIDAPHRGVLSESQKAHGPTRGW